MWVLVWIALGLLSVLAGLMLAAAIFIAAIAVWRASRGKVDRPSVLLGGATIAACSVTLGVGVFSIASFMAEI